MSERTIMWPICDRGKPFQVVEETATQVFTKKPAKKSRYKPKLSKVGRDKDE